MAGVTLDAGALIAVERGDPRLAALLDEATAAEAEIAIPAGALAQAWRGSARQARLGRLLRLESVRVVPLGEPEARAAGALCARTGTRDIVDASVALCARERGHAVVTGDPSDLARLSPGLRLIVL